MKLKRKLTYAEAYELVYKNKKLFKELYIDKDLTSKKVAENQNIQFDNNFAKVLLRVLGAKEMGHGGKRPGSGNKKGIKFCSKCGKKLDKQHACRVQTNRTN